MTEKAISGFEEIEHTADWALRVWAPDLAGLFEQAALGMYHLMGVETQPTLREKHTLVLQAQDAEDLLVGFLTELLYVLERDELVFDDISAQVQTGLLTVRLEGGLCAHQRKEIKAVTYHQLEIQQTESGYAVVIVFDV